MTKPCVSKLFSSDNLNGPLIGLSIHEGNLCLDEKLFPCCGGAGQRFNDEENRVDVCDLHWRLIHVKKLFSQYYQYWHNEYPLLPQDLNRNSLGVDLKLLKDMVSGRAPSGKTFRRATAKGPSALWPWALALTWRYGIACHVVCFGKTPQANYLPKEQHLPKDGRKFAILLGRVDHLGDPTNANEFEGLVSYAYHANSLLFLEFVDGSLNQAASNQEATRAQPFFTKKISELKKRSPTLFLQPDCLSRIENMCGSLNF